MWLNPNSVEPKPAKFDKFTDSSLFTAVINLI